MANVKYTMDKAGIMEIAKSAGVKSALEAQAKRIAAAANADARSHADWLYKKRFETDPYIAGSKTLSRTAIGYVNIKTSVGDINENKYKSLSNMNH